MRQARLPWAEAGSRFTHLFEALTIDVLLAANVKRAAQLLRISWDQAWHLIMQHVGQGVDRVRKQEHKELLQQGDTTLTRSKHLWLYSAENRLAAAQARFGQIKHGKLKTARAWAMKESLREMWSYTSAGWARRFWDRWYFWATHSRLAPMIEKAKLMARHLPNILTYFTHRLTNAVAEGLNSKIATVQKRTCGFRNRDHFKIVVYFHCGGLDLYPASVTHRKV